MFLVTNGMISYDKNNDTTNDRRNKGDKNNNNDRRIKRDINNEKSTMSTGKLSCDKSVSSCEYQIIIMKVILIDIEREISINTIYQRVKETMSQQKVYPLVNRKLKLVIKRISVKVTSLLMKVYPQANRKLIIIMK